MTFFARPNLDDVQFRQETGSTLTLSGSTIISSFSGLSLSDNYGDRIPIVISGQSEGKVMTYKSGCIVLSEITTTANITYSGASPTTCTVGGLVSGTDISGCNINKIIEMMASPVVSPTLTPPFATLSLNPNPSVYEVGSSISFIATGCYNMGSVSPVYCNGPSTRTGLPTEYNFFYNGGVPIKITTSNLCTTTSINGVVSNGNNGVGLYVCYSAGEYPKRSNGDTVGMTCCPAGVSSTVCVNFVGTYPYFWGSSDTKPVINQTLINSANKCVGISRGNVIVSNYDVVGKYIWFAIPSESATKTKWQGSNSPTNCGTIPGDLFDSEVVCAINSPNNCWSNVSYKFYVSNYPTSINYQMTFKNS